jgi:hypothetical protein
MRNDSKCIPNIFTHKHNHDLNKVNTKTLM